MRKLAHSVICLWVVCLLTSCGNDREQRVLQLEQLEQQNRSGQPMLNDSLAEDLVRYFDRHGDANQRMRSRYILGRTYYCLGELPRALETYNEAVDCADTTSADCDFAKLSRIYAQKASIYYDQVQARSQLSNLRLANYYAEKGLDTLMAVECFSQQSNAYELLDNQDSVVLIKEMAAQMFNNLAKTDRAAQTLGSAILALVKKGELSKAKSFIDIYESSSNLFSPNKDIVSGREVYYYIKGNYYLSINKVDSAEYLFRKELKDGKDLNNQIAGCKGLQIVYEKRRITDSIAKYAKLSYELNDSAYLQSEMQNIQKFQASYNYNHLKYKVEKKELEAERAWLVVALVSILFILFGVYFGRKYFGLRKIALDYRLRKANITHHLKKLANSNPPQYPTIDDWDKLRALVEHEIPTFHKILKVDELSLTELEYDICLMM